MTGMYKNEFKTSFIDSADFYFYILREQKINRLYNKLINYNFK